MPERPGSYRLCMPFLAVLMTLLSLVGVPAGTSPKISWHACALSGDDQLGTLLDQAGARCGDLRVPVDHRRPGGPATTVALARIPATDPAQRRGALLLNPGGPGASGLELALGGVHLFGDLAEHYDLVGMDPRFTGRSNAIECEWRTDTFLRSAGPDRRTFDRGVALMRRLAAGCARGGADRLAYATTRNTARDMDLVRRALGETKLNYLGFSYGTYLGAVYLQMFGAHAGRFVLDSAVDPEQYGPALFARNAPAMDAALRHWAAWAADRDDEYHLGGTVPAVLATVERLRRPLRIGEHRVDAEFLPYYLFARLSLAEPELLAAELTHFGKAGALPETLSAFLRGFFTGEGNPADRYGTPVLCADRPVARDPGVYYRDIAAHRAGEPLFGPVVRNISPCAFWPVRGAEAPTRIGNDAPVLVVGADGDPVTPYAGQLAMRRALRGSSMVTLRGAYRHAVFGVAGSACVVDVVVRFLLDRPVARDTRC